MLGFAFLWALLAALAVPIRGFVISSLLFFIPVSLSIGVSAIKDALSLVTHAQGLTLLNAEGELHAVMVLFETSFLVLLPLLTTLNRFFLYLNTLLFPALIVWSLYRQRCVENCRM